MEDPLWELRLRFSVDITEKLNVLNKKLQGEYNLITNYIKEIKKFIENLKSWIEEFKNKNFTSFCYVSEFIDKINVCECVKLTSELLLLLNSFEQRFQNTFELELKFRLFLSPLYSDISKFKIEFQDEIKELRADVEFEDMWNNLNDKKLLYQKFFKNKSHLFPNFIDHISYIFSIFGSTYLCESLFSKMKIVKSKTRSKITRENLNNQLMLACNNYEINQLPE